MAVTGIEILLVEDNANDEKLTLHALEKRKLAGKAHVVRDGAEALEFVFCTGTYAQRSFENPRVILLDKELPLVGGLEVLRQIRQDKRTWLIPVVLLTSSQDSNHVREGYALGVNSYIFKSVDSKQFGETVQQLSEYWLQINKTPPMVS